MPQGRQPSIPLSVIILTSGRPRQLARALDSVLREGRDRHWEILVVGNGEAESAEWEGLARWIETPRMNPGAARNFGIAEAQGDWILFLDDDAWLPQGAGQTVEGILASSWAAEAEIIGGPNLTPQQASPFESRVGQALASPFGAWFSRPRYRAIPHRRGPCGDESVMLCNLLVRRRFLEQSRIRFEPLLSCNEENFLVRDSLAVGARVFYEPGFTVWHDRRPDWMSLARQVRKYGRGRAQQSLLDPGSLRLGHLVPAFFAIYCFLLPLLASWNGVWLTPLLLYCLLSLLASWQAGNRKLFGVFLTIHLSYAVGFLEEFTLHVFQASIQHGARRVGPVRLRT